MDAQRQCDVLIMDQEDDWDAGRSYMGPDPEPEFEQSVADKPPMRDYLEREWMEGDDD
jgi:hypothetical protein